MIGTLPLTNNSIMLVGSYIKPHVEILGRLQQKTSAVGGTGLCNLSRRPSFEVPDPCTEHARHNRLEGCVELCGRLVEERPVGNLGPTQSTWKLWSEAYIRTLAGAATYAQYL